MAAFVFGFLNEIFNFFLAFILVFAIFYSILTNAINSSISFSIGLIFALSGAFKFIVKLIPFFALMIIMFSAIFLVLMLLGFKVESLMKSKWFVGTLITVSVIFILLTSWNLYYNDVKEQLELFSLENVDINETQLTSNLT